MSALAKFEGFMERMMEGSFTRLFHSPIHPAEIAKKLERAVESNQSIGVGKVFAPNFYEVCLHSEDFAVFEPFRLSLEREMAAFVVDLAKERGYSIMGRVQVTLREDPEVRKRGIQVATKMVDASPEPPKAGPERTDLTQVMMVPRVKPKAPTSVSLEIMSGSQKGRRIPLTKGVVNMGRDLENDVVLEDASISRFHAQIKHKHGQHCLSDLRSTNGTRVNGLAITERVLGDGDRITLGDIDIIVTMR